MTLEQLRAEADRLRTIADRSSSYWDSPADRDVAQAAAVEAEAAYFAELIKRQAAA